jgi:hypothetical protein
MRPCLSATVIYGALQRHRSCLQCFNEAVAHTTVNVLASR